MAFWISVSNILLHGTPKVRWRLKNTPFWKENVDRTVWLKNTPFWHFFGLGCVASYVAIDHCGGGGGLLYVSNIGICDLIRMYMPSNFVNFSKKNPHTWALVLKIDLRTVVQFFFFFFFFGGGGGSCLYVKYTGMCHTVWSIFTEIYNFWFVMKIKKFVLPIWW